MRYSFLKIKTLFADTNTLDLVTCYMQKNINAAKPHNEARDKFISNLKDYNWQTDTQKLKPIQDAAEAIPQNLQWREPNFVQVKNSLDRAEALLNTFINNQEFTRCDEIKKIKIQTEALVKDYCKSP